MCLLVLTFHCPILLVAVEVVDYALDVALQLPLLDAVLNQQSTSFPLQLAALVFRLQLDWEVGRVLTGAHLDQISMPSVVVMVMARLLVN